LTPLFNSSSAFREDLIVVAWQSQLWDSYLQIFVTLLQYLIGLEGHRYSQEPAHSPTSEECCRHSRHFDMVEYIVSTHDRSIFNGPSFLCSWVVHISRRLFRCFSKTPSVSRNSNPALPTPRLSSTPDLHPPSSTISHNIGRVAVHIFGAYSFADHPTETLRLPSSSFYHHYHIRKTPLTSIWLQIP
jgi:hypothetical protein